MNHRQLQKVTKLSLDDNNPTDVEIKQKLAERKTIMVKIDLGCKNVKESKD